MQFLSAQPLRRQIVVATCALLLMLAGGIVWSTDRTRSERQEEVRQEARSVARLAAAYLNQYFDGLDAMASALMRHPAIPAHDATECAKLFAGVLSEQPLLLNIVLRDRSGLLVAAGVDVPADRTSAPAPQYLMDVLRTGRPGVSELFAGPLTGRPTIAQAYPVRAADGRVVGALALSLNLFQLQHVFDNLALPDGSVVTLLDQRGQILARSPDGEKYIGRTIEADAVPATDEVGSTLRADVDGVERFVGTESVARGPWSLNVGIPQTVVADRLAPLWWRTLMISCAAVLAALGLSLWLSHQTSTGLERIRAAAQRIAGGDLSPPSRARAANLEIAELQDAFITMAANLLATRDALDRQVEQERKMREMVQSLQRQVVRQERLAAVGLLVSGVAHELNNPLQAILGTAELLERDPRLSAASLEEITLLKTQSGRACEIIRSLSRFGSQQSGPPALVDLRTVIMEVVQLRRHDLEKSSIAIDVETSTSSRVYANVTELEQVTLSFVINAQQAIESAARERGRILIRLYEAGRKVRLEVQDDGPGVSPENEPKLFQPFFTTKPVGKGTGLGLSVSYGIIDSYGGAIGCRGNEWGGATFFFELPAADVPPANTTVVAGASISF
ncbi:MAG: cache domain-containing protein [Vicinamibacterales bacterium]|nr:cache domain-containing protein [Vicinamibacterales bacterium]